MNREILDKLYASFELRERKGLGGMTFKYIPSDSIIDRMNKTFDGNWSTVVSSQEVIEDSVLLRVLVSVLDPETNAQFSHEGYGSSSFKRYKDGFNKGQIIDVGNAYKSALSMAIRNACARFGCGLYLEGDPENVENVPVDSNVPENLPPSNFSTQKGPAVMPTPPPTFTTPETSKQESLPPIPAPKQESLPPIPPLSKEPKNSGPSNSGPAIPSIPPAPVTGNKSPSVSEMNFNTSEDGLSNVQEAAITALVDTKGLDYVELASEAFADAGLKFDKIPEMKDLKNSDAAVIIKYGNQKARR